MNGKIPVYNNYAIVTANVVLTKPQNKNIFLVLGIHK